MQSKFELQRLLDAAEKHSKNTLGRALTAGEIRRISARYRQTGTTVVQGDIWDLGANWRPMPRCGECLEYLHMKPCTRQECVAS